MCIYRTSGGGGDDRTSEAQILATKSSDFKYPASSLFGLTTQWSVWGWVIYDLN